MSTSFLCWDRARVKTAITRVSSAMSESSVPSLFSLDSAYASWWLIPGQWIISKLYFIIRSLHLESFPVATARFSIHFKLWWSVSTVNPVPSKYGRLRSLARTAARHTWRVVSRFLSRSLNSLEHYPFCLLTFWSGFCNKAHPIWWLHASVSNVYRPIFLGSYSTAGEIRFSCKVRETASSSSFNY